MRTARLIAVSLVPLALLACGGGGTGTGTGPSSTEPPASPSASDTDAQPAEEAPTDGAAADASTQDAAGVTAAPATAPAGLEDADGVVVGGGLDPICDTLPSLEVISAIVGEPLSVLTDLSDVTIEGSGIISQKCEATGDGASLAIFERLDTETAQLIVEASGQEPVRFPGDADLADAQGVLNAMLVDRDGVTWMATAIRMDWVASVDNPLAYETSGELLRAWLAEN